VHYLLDILQGKGSVETVHDLLRILLEKGSSKLCITSTTWQKRREKDVHYFEFLIAV
jgi:hypothetical protein